MATRPSPPRSRSPQRARTPAPTWWATPPLRAPFIVDTNLVNPWGIAFGPTSPAWLANNHSETSTLYNGNGVAQALVVAVPAGFDPTGIVFNSSTDFVVTSGAEQRRGALHLHR